MKIAILGYGAQGKSAFDYWNKPGNELTVCDSREDIQLPRGSTSHLGSNYLKGLADFDLIVRAAPSIHPREITDANSPDILAKVTSNTNEFFKVCPTRNIVGVTGTKGKGTTSALISKILEAAGRHVHLGGNFGTAPLDLLKENIGVEDYVVLELANFQLIDIKYSPHLAVCLMIGHEHLDWHDDFEEYLHTKQQMFVYQKSDDIAIYFGQNEYSRQAVSVSPAQKIPYMQPPGAEVKDGHITIDGQTICAVEDIQLLGEHNWQNVCAAVTAVWQIEQDKEAMLRVIRAFRGLPHRLEYVREVDNVRYFNDSFASAPDATIAALDAIKGSKIMIVGGFDRGIKLNDFANAFKQHEHEIKKAVLIGASAERAAEAFKAHDFTTFEIFPAKTMSEIVEHAKSLAENGDSVVLTPGFPSFDMFKNFEERGELFKQAVNAL